MKTDLHDVLRASADHGEGKLSCRDTENLYLFRGRTTDANKIQIKKAVETLFEVKVDSGPRPVRVHGKVKRRPAHRRAGPTGRRPT